MPGNTPVLGDTVQCRLVSSAGDQVGMNVLHYRIITTAGGGLTLQQMATQMSNAVGALQRSLMPISTIFQYVTFQNLTPPMTVAFRQTAASSGTAIGNLTPRQVSCLIGTQTAIAGRANRGRVYIPFPSDTFVSAAGELTGAGFAILVNIASALGPAVTLTFGGATTNMALTVRHPDVAVPVPHTPSTTDVVSMVPAALLATQRRRGDYGRSNRP